MRNFSALIRSVINQSISKPALVLVCLMLVVLGVQAQPSMYKSGYPTTTGTTSSGQFTTAVRKTQSLYLPGDLTGVTPGTITKVYFQYGTGGPQQFTNFTIRLRQTDSTAFNGTSFFTGLTPVFAPASPYTLPTASLSAGGWIEFNLTTPITYDPTKTLIVETNTSAAPTGTIVQTMNTTLAGRKLFSNTAGSGSGTATSTWSNIGFYVEPSIADNANLTAVGPTNGSTIGTGNTPINVKIRNFGSATLNDVTVDWTINGVAQPQVTFNGLGLATYDTTTQLLGNFNFASLGYYTITATSSLPNGLSDGQTSNDATNTAFKVCDALNGNYFINGSASVTSGNTFKNFAEMTEFLTACGVSGPVNFTVQNGPFNETASIVFGNISGTGPSAPIYFDGNDQDVNYAGVSSSTRDVFTFNHVNARYITIENLNINATGTQHGWGVHMMGDANNNSIIDCDVTISSTSTTANDAAGIILNGSASTYDTGDDDVDNNVIDNNRVTGGVSGIVVAGGFNSGITSTVISNNTVTDFYLQGIYVKETDGVQVFGNNVSRPTLTTAPTAIYGIYMNGDNQDARVYNNLVYKLAESAQSTTGTITGIYLRSNDEATASNPNYIYNNQVYDLKNTGNVIFINEEDNTYTGMFYNTLVVDHPGAGGTTSNYARGYMHTTANLGLEFKNNIIYINRGGVAIHAGIYNATTSGDQPVVDYNVIYVPGGFVGSWGALVAGRHATLGAWQAASAGMDNNSRNIDPLFADLGNADFTPTEANASNFGTPVAITEDMFSNPRDASNPDPGSIEWTPVGTDAAITWVSPAGPVTAGPVNITVNVLNASTTTITSINITYNDGGTPVSQTFSTSLASGANADLTFSTQLTAGAYHAIRAYINSVNGGADDNQVNDTTGYVTICQALPAGNYTINQAGQNTATNFKNFNALADRLITCGIAGPITVTVTPGSGPYLEQVSFPTISGAGPTSRITIDGNNEVLEFTTNAARHLIRLDGAQFFTIRNLTLRMGTGCTFFYGVHLLGTASNNIIEDNFIDMATNSASATSTSGGQYQGVIANASVGTVTAEGEVHNITIDGNTFDGGTRMGHAIRIMGDGTNLSTNIVISNNTITGGKDRGILAYNTTGMRIEGNTLSSNVGQGGVIAHSAFYLWETHVDLKVLSNTISYTAGGNWEGLMISELSGANSIISNNLFHNIRVGDNGVNAIQLGSAGTGAKIYHNTFVLDDQTATAGNVYAIYEDDANSGFDYKNNLFYITHSGTGIKAAYSLSGSTDLATGLTSNNNVFYIPGGYVANFRSTTPANYTLAQWQAITVSQDANSLQVDPNFQTGTAIPTNGLINNKGVSTAITGVTTDILGTTRNTLPDPGAYEFTPPPNDAAILNHVNGCGSPMNVIFRLGNAGTATLTSVTISWTVNGVSQPDYNWTGSIAPGDSANVTVGTYPVAVNTEYDFTATTSLPNGSPIDGNPANDSFTRLDYRLGLNGAYTINKNIATGGVNFASFNDFSSTLSAYGICGPVVATVATGSGPYTEQVVFGAVNGASAINTITIDGNGDSLQFGPTVITSAHILKFTNNAQHFIVENLKIKTTNASMGWLVHFDNAHNITLRDNIMYVGTTTTTDDVMGIYAGHVDGFSGSRCDNLKIIGNEVIGGYTGISIDGLQASHSQKPLIQDNLVREMYLSGIEASYTDSLSIVGNTVTRPNRGGTANLFCIQISSGNLGFRIYNNEVKNINSAISNTVIGIQIYGFGANPSTGQIYNNLIYGLASTGTQYGIEDNTMDGSSVSAWYNTIVLDGALASGVGTTTAYYLFYNTSTGTSSGTHVVRNNIFYISRGGTGTKTIFNSNSTTSTFTSNNNVMYIAPGTPGTLQYGRHSSSNIYPTFVDWQNSGRDVNGVSADPMFVNPASNLNPTNTAIANIGFPVTAQVDVDITGADRSNTTPDPGAYEFCGTGEWNGSVDNDWFTAGNWCASVIPTSATNVVIPNVSTGSNTYPVVEGPGTAVAGNITIHAGASINLTAPGGNMPTLEIYGNVSNSGTANLGTGNLTFRGTTQSLTGPLQINGIVSVLTGSTLNTNDNLTIESGGQLLHGVGTTGGGGIVNGNIKIKRNGWGSSTRWNYWGSPVEGAQTNILGTRTHYYDPTSATDPNTTAGLRAGWKTYSGTMAPGVGYISQNGGAVTFNGPVDDLNANITLTAPINAGVVPYNLIGNPFPSAMDAALFMDQNGPDGSGVITGSMWFWDDDGTGGTGYTKSDFAAWNSTGGVAAGPNTSRTPNGHIATGQGFNVEKTTTGPGVVEFNNTMRSSNNNVYFRQKPIERLWVNVTNTHGLYNEVLIGFIDEATDGYDSKYDTKKMRGNENIALYTKLGGKDYMIQGYGPLTNGGKVVELGIDVGLTGTHTLSLKTMENMDETVIPMLEDRLTGTWQNLRMNPSYSFNVTARGSIVERFYIHFNAPLEITATDASCAGDDAQIVMNQVGGTLWNYLVVDPQGNLVATDNGFTGSIAFNDLASGDYTILLSDRHGYQFTKHITVDGKQMVTADFEASNIAFVNEEITFTNHSNGAATYDWDFGDGTVLTGVQNPSHTYTEPGTYTVMLRASNADCYHNRYSTIEVSKLSTGIGSLTEDGYNVYSYGKKIFVNLNLDGEKVRLQVFDLVGKEVYGNHIAAKGNYQVDLSSYPDDAYFVIIRTASQTYPVKVMLSGN